MSVESRNRRLTGNDLYENLAVK